jgi:endonuclease/exonuclease/phosphatase family metal-dependent hydrolase
VLSHNVGGGAENDGGAAGIAYTFSRIDAAKPDVVMLEEVCQAQVDAFKARYARWSVLFAPMTTNVGGDKCGGTPKGQLLASPRAMTEEIRKDLGDPDGVKSFTLLCGEVPMPDTQRKVLACVTHLRATGADRSIAEAARKRQAWRIADTLDPRVNNGQAVVLAGDFNSGPDKDSLDYLYRLTSSGNPTGGKFDEADQTDADRESYARRDDVRCAAEACRTGEGTMSTNNAKLDYVFFSHNRVAGGQLGAEVAGSGGSGHKVYQAWAKLDL